MDIGIKGKYINLDGNIDKPSEEIIIRLNLYNDFTEGQKGLGIVRVYAIPNSGRSCITLTNMNNSKQLMLSPVYLDDAAINNKRNTVFYVKVNPYELNFIRENLLTSDLVINWHMEWYGFIEHESINRKDFGRITISNINYTDTKLSQNEFYKNIWEKITGEKIYLIDIPDLNPDIFAKVQNNMDGDALKEFFGIIKDRTPELKSTIKRYESADNKGDFISIARNIKAILDKVKFNVKTANDNSQEYLEGLLFDNLFSGPGTNRASKGMMDGIIDIFNGITKISNQLGHEATEDAKYYSFSGDKDTVKTFLFITSLLFDYIGKRLKS